MLLEMIKLVKKLLKVKYIISFHLTYFVGD